MKAKIMIILGSASDIDIAKKSVKILEKLEIPYSLKVASAHRTHNKVKKLVQEGTKEGIDVFIGIAGLAAHLPGVIAAYTHKPVIGVPVNGALDGIDSLYSCVQMPYPVPVLTVGIGRGDNAAILAGEILSLNDENIEKNISKLRDEYRLKVENGEESVLSEIDGEYIDKDFLSNIHDNPTSIETIEPPSDVCIISGSYSDMSTTKKLIETLKKLNISFTTKVISPLRYSEEFEEYVLKMRDSKVFIAVNGLSALVAGSIVALTHKPVVGVPVKSEFNIEDSLLSMVQMPPGVPVGCVSVDNGANAGIVTGEILALSDKNIEESLKMLKKKSFKV